MEHPQNTISSQEQAEASSFVYEAGRRFHGEKNAPYVLANDLTESDRLDGQHRVLKHLLNGNYMSKLNDPQKALEVGSGTGIWAKEMAEEFPQCEIDCIDISPAPSLVKFPNNVKFKTMNVIEGIKCEDNTFDYAHMRLLCAAMPEDSWPIVIKDLARVCKSGGSIELVETDAKLVNAGPFGQEVDRWYDAVCRSRGIDLNKTRQIPQMMQEAGLQVETEHYIEFPLGEWCDQVGHQGWHDVFSLIHSLSAKIIAVNNVTQERIDYVLGKLHEENVANRVYWRMGVYVGRKP